MIICVDMDAFFASVEQQCAYGALDDQPVMVCGNTERRSVVAAANYIAREYGIRAGTPITTARRLCPHGVFLEGDPEKYVYTCIRINDLCREFTPRVECFSIDESFLDISGSAHLFGGPAETGRRLKARIRAELGIPCTVGIGPNKLLAKTASKLGKPDGLFTLNHEDVPAKLHPLPITKLYGIGARTAEKLARIGVSTIGQLARTPPDALKKLFGIIGPMLRDAANGLDSSPLLTDDEQPEAKSVGNSYTLSDDTRDVRRVLTVLLGLCSKVGRRMRQGGHAGRTVTLTLRYANFQTFVRARTVEAPINLDRDIFAAACTLLDEIWGRDIHRESSESGESGTSQPHSLDSRDSRFRHSRRAVRLLGVSVSNLLHRDDPRQLGLFDSDLRRRTHQFLKSVDALRDRYGEHVAVWAPLLRSDEVI
ncbi:MAG TPA: DNA polymerase IV [Planctomycetota bacterium]|nr:DNA polymerase IV [Planctomycetota bacterium]HRR81628.1 DNA polymerase IV [Planctomycetota bacterium]